MVLDHWEDRIALAVLFVLTFSSPLAIARQSKQNSLTVNLDASLGEKLDGGEMRGLERSGDLGP
jgi:hypothetical protein